MKENYRARNCEEFVMPVLMSLGFYDKKSKKAKEIENEVCEILEITDEERLAYFDATPEIRILRSKLDWTLYKMWKNGLIERKSIGVYCIMNQGEKMLLNY
ncbi:MAG: winged helix-turn-helix domain-containing protein [Holosporales bacterium]|jgi:restriction endonuclease Mrr|nr:winged helix-turn-helix domain-containing protein [Holosporales bacterium]